jgi:hypothetical protein
MNTESIKKRSQILEKQIEEGIQWVSKNLPADERKSVVLNLKKHRRDNNRYRKALGKRPVVCLFGESQVGKSYAVTNMATTEDRTTFYVKNPESNSYINFLQEINPEGQGREATGVVTRFTVQNNYDSSKPPFKLVLLSQTDVVKIISNSYFSDFQGLSFNVDRDAILEKIANYKLSVKSKKSTNNAYSEDEIYEIKEYLESRFSDKAVISDLRQMQYWDEIINILPFLNIDERCDILEVLWGKVEYFSQLFILLNGALDKINNENVAYVNQNVIAPKSDTIVDVQRLNDIYKSSEEFLVSVVTESGNTQKINRGVLSALTLELVLLLPEYLKDRENRKFLNHIDILDFPGARSRKKVEYEAFLQNTDELKTEMFLRGKVAYLFEKYSYQIEISSLMFCMHDVKSEVTDLPHFLYGWIKNNIGSTPKQREKFILELQQLIPSGIAINPLLLVLTKYNNNLQWQDHTDKLEPNSHNYKWSHRLKDFLNNFLTEPVDDKWVNNWIGDNVSFKNTFLLRDPLYSKNIFDEIETKKINENGVSVESSVIRANPTYQPLYDERLNVIKDSFLSNKYVNAYFHNPEKAWYESSTPGNTGMSYILEYLEPVSNPIIRVTKIEELIDDLTETVLNDLLRYYDDGDHEKKLREAKIQSAKTAVAMLKFFKEQRQFGSFLRSLLIEEDEAWKAYWNFRNAKYEDNGNNKTANDSYEVSNKAVLETIGYTYNDNISFLENYEAAKSMLGFDDDEMKEIGLDYAEDVQEKRKEPSDYLSEELLSIWVIKIDRMLKEHKSIKDKTLNKEIAESLINNLKESKNRLQMANNLSSQLKPHIESHASTINYNIVPYIATRFINTFVYNAGNGFKFEQLDNIEIPDKENLSCDSIKSGEILFDTWKQEMMKAYTENVLYKSTVKDEEKLKNNGLLGKIVKTIQEINV